MLNERIDMITIYMLVGMSSPYLVKDGGMNNLLLSHIVIEFPAILLHVDFFMVIFS